MLLTLHNSTNTLHPAADSLDRASPLCGPSIGGIKLLRHRNLVHHYMIEAPLEESQRFRVPANFISRPTRASPPLQ
jgi:hypothetical protein